MRTSGKCKINLESYLFIYLLKFSLPENFQMNFKKMEGGALQKNELKY